MTKKPIDPNTEIWIKSISKNGKRQRQTWLRSNQKKDAEPFEEPDTPAEIIANAVKSYRDSKGLSRTRLAEMMEVHTSTVTRMENGSEGLNSTTLKKFCVLAGYTFRLLNPSEERDLSKIKKYNKIKTIVNE